MTKAHRRGRPRNEQARQRIADVGCSLFVRNGYVSTTIGEIASEAEVSVQTIYSAFTSKVGVLKAAHDFAIGGADERPLLEREWAEQLDKASSVEEGWNIALDHVAQATAQVASIYFVIQSASSDPDVALLLSELHQQRRRFSRSLAERLLNLPGARSDADLERVADVLYSCASIASYGPLVAECGWTIEQWQAWVFEVGVRELCGF